MNKERRLLFYGYKRAGMKGSDPVQEKDEEFDDFKKIGCDWTKAPSFSSPTSCLPQKQQEELEARIEEANALLLRLSLSNDQPEEGRRLSFEGLIGQWAEVIVIRDTEAGLPAAEKKQPLKQNNATDEKTAARRKKTFRKRAVTIPANKRIRLKKRPTARKQKTGRAAAPRVKTAKKQLHQKKLAKSRTLFYKESGRVYVVGRNFILLKKKKYEILIPFSRVHSIKSFNRYPQLIKEPVLLNINPCLRQSLTFNFGETVASSPELLHLFFRMTIPIFLLGYIDKKVKIVWPEKSITGFVHEVDKETITLMTDQKERRRISLHSIYSIASSSI